MKFKYWRHDSSYRGTGQFRCVQIHERWFLKLMLLHFVHVTGAILYQPSNKPTCIERSKGNPPYKKNWKRRKLYWQRSLRRTEKVLKTSHRVFTMSLIQENILHPHALKKKVPPVNYHWKRLVYGRTVHSDNPLFWWLISGLGFYK